VAESAEDLPGRRHALLSRQLGHWRTRLPGRPRPGNRADRSAAIRKMQFSLRRSPPSGTHRQRGPSVAVRGKPTVSPTARPARTPSAIRPWTPQHIDAQ